MRKKQDHMLRNTKERATSPVGLGLTGLLVKACQRAGSPILSYYLPCPLVQQRGRAKDLRAVDKESSDPRTVVTAADLASENAILSLFKSELRCRVLSEEAGELNSDQDAEFRVIIDSLDGSKNFLQGSFGLFGISIAVENRGQLVAGAIGLPWFNELVVAEIGKGAFISPLRSNSRRHPIRIRPYSGPSLNLSRARICIGRGAAASGVLAQSPISGILTAANEALNYASCSVGLSAVLLQRVDALVLPSQRYWDFAGGLVIVRELGGQFGIWRENWKQPTDDNDLAAATTESYFDVVATLDPKLFTEIKSLIERS